MRSILAIAALLLGAAGCMQDPDLVANATQLSQAGMSGAGGSGGIGGQAAQGAQNACDGGIAKTFVKFFAITDDCKYQDDDPLLVSLLNDLIYSMPAPQLTLAQAEANRDQLCEAWEMALPQEYRPLRWRLAIEDTDFMRLDQTPILICPRYCEALRSWIRENSAMALSCLPESGM